jgi:hypothetical protein
MSALKGHVQLVESRVRLGDFPQEFPKSFEATDVWYRDFRTVLGRELEGLIALANAKNTSTNDDIEELEAKLESEVEQIFQHLEDVDSPSGGEFETLQARVTELEESIEGLLEGVLDDIELANYYTKAEVDSLLENTSGGPAHKIISMPSDTDANGIVAYSGFATDFEALPSEGKWAVKKQFQDGTELWAGKTQFDQTLDNYLSLTYS